MKWWIVLLALFMAAPAVAAGEDDDFLSTWYIGAGLGGSFLRPDTTTSGYLIEEDRDLGYSLFVGYDWTRDFTFELEYSNLGTAVLDGQGLPGLQNRAEIDYEMLSLSALWYYARWNDKKFLLQLGQDSAYTKRSGLQAYAKVGLADPRYTGDVEYKQLNPYSLHWGGGMEYAWENGFAARLGADLYDKDAAFVYLAGLKRFGKKPVPPPEPIPVPKSEPVVASVIPDDDQDGVPNYRDACLTTPLGTPVNLLGCSIFDVALDGVNFETNSAQLTPDSTVILDDAVEALQLIPAVVVEVQAHTDSRGSDSYNLKLSERRAASVREYLVSKGIPAERLVSKGYGEVQPIADNETKEGRAKNRRVELALVGGGRVEKAPEREIPERYLPKELRQSP